MRFSNIQRLIFLLIIPLYFCCKKIISVNLNNAAPQIVIQGNITNGPGPYQVNITQTVNFSANNYFPPVDGATVKITDVTAGATNLLAETSPGVYTTGLLVQGMPGHAYQLNILLPTGQTYQATSTMPQPVELDSISFQQLANFGKTQINTQANFQDPAGIANYYTFQEYINSKLLQQTFVFDDRLSDGRYINDNLYTDSSYISVGDTILLQMNCVDKNVYNYYNSLYEASDANSFQSTAPSNPISNISNNALGYFSANTVSTRKALVQ